MTTHTPGPWTAQHDLRSWKNTGVITQGPYAWGVYGTRRLANLEENEDATDAANAQLIAAAPELLEALNAALSLLADINGLEAIKGNDVAALDLRQRCKAIQHRAYTAIAKATEVKP